MDRSIAGKVDPSPANRNSEKAADLTVIHRGLTEILAGLPPSTPGRLICILKLARQEAERAGAKMED